VSPAQLDHAGIEALVPHRGAMCLLDRMVSWDESRIECLATGHRDPAHPLRSRSGLMAGTAIEYAAQAAALHGGLVAQASGATASPGYLASAREVRLDTWRLDDLPPAATDALRIVVVDHASETVTFAVRAADASDAFVHPFIYAGRAVCEDV